MINFDYAAFSDVGLVRKTNQDAGYASSHLLVLADGMGGAAGGDVASSVVVGNMAAIDDSHQAEDLLSLLKNQLNLSQRQMAQLVREAPHLEGLGTTCVALLRTGNKLGMVHVGDSRAYLLRNGKLTQITRDHTLVQYLVDHGQITAEEALHHPKRHVIMKNISATNDPADVDASIREARPGDRWLLTSDGLFDVVSQETLEQTLLTFTDLRACGERLIELALAGGAPDNVTVVLADVIDDDDEATTYDHGPIIVGAAALDRHKPTRAGSSAAGQLAALTAPDPAPENNDDSAPTPAKPRHWLRRLAIAVACLVVIAAGLGGGYAWTQTQYYVGTHHGKVVIFRGIPQTLGPVELSDVYEETNIMTRNLSPVAQQRLNTPITRNSLDEARKVINDLAAQKQSEVAENSRIKNPPPGYEIPEKKQPKKHEDTQ